MPDVVFKLREASGFVPDLIYGQRGYELECFIPDGYEWTQENYGQGEGQVLIDGNEWGFYYSNDGIHVVLHEGVISESESIEFAKAAAKKIYSGHCQSLEMLLNGREIELT